MSDYLANLTAKAFGWMPVIQPRLPFLFEPLPPANGLALEQASDYERGQPHTPVPRSETQNTWTDGKHTTGRRTAVPVVAAAALLSLTLLVGAAVVLFQTRGPTVAVAGRSHAALQTALVRLGGEMERIRADALAAQRAKDADQARAGADSPAPKGPGPATDPAPAQRPSGVVPAAATAAPPVSAKAVAPLKPHKNDPQSAVPGPGF